MSTTVAFRGGDDVAAYWCPQVSPPPDEAQPSTASSGNLRVWSPPSSSVRSWDYLLALLSTSFSGTTIFRARGRRHLLVYVDDFPAAASTSVWVFSRFPQHELFYAGGPEAASSFAHGMLPRDAEGTWC
jgi:hypothetical protein